MDCEVAQQMIADELRGRLPAVSQAALREHLAQCAACEHELRAGEELDRALVESLPRYQAPESLRARIANLSREPAPAASRVSRVRSSLLVAAAVAAGVALGGWATYSEMQRSNGETALVREAINDHLRIAFSEHPIEIASGGIHQVKPWFTGKVDFAPVVAFAGDDDFPLLGGSVAYFVDRKAAAFHFQRRLHKISLFVVPAEGLQWPRSSEKVRGFNVLLWQRNGLGYALVSDVAMPDLEALASKLNLD